MRLSSYGIGRVLRGPHLQPNACLLVWVGYVYNVFTKLINDRHRGIQANYQTCIIVCIGLPGMLILSFI